MLHLLLVMLKCGREYHVPDDQQTNIYSFPRQSHHGSNSHDYSKAGSNGHHNSNHGFHQAKYYYRGAKSSSHCSCFIHPVRETYLQSLKGRLTSTTPCMQVGALRDPSLKKAPDTEVYFRDHDRSRPCSTLLRGSIHPQNDDGHGLVAHEELNPDERMRSNPNYTVRR